MASFMSEFSPNETNLTYNDRTTVLNDLYTPYGWSTTPDRTTTIPGYTFTAIPYITQTNTITRDTDLFTRHYLKFIKNVLNIKIFITIQKLYNKTTKDNLVTSAEQITQIMQTNNSTLNQLTNEDCYWLTILIKPNISTRMAGQILLNNYNATEDTKTEIFCNEYYKKQYTENYAIQPNELVLKCGHTTATPHNYICLTNKDMTLTTRILLTTMVQTIIKNHHPEKAELYNKYITALSTAILERDYSKYKEIVHKYYENEIKPNLNDITTTALTKILQEHNQAEKTRITDKIKQYEQRIQQTLNILSADYEKIQDLNNTLTGLMLNAANTEEKYKKQIQKILTYKSLKNIKATDSNITITIQTPVTNYDEKLLEKILQSNNTIEKYRITPTIKTILTEIFINKNYKLNCYTVCVINLLTNSYTRGAYTDSDNLPNPHMAGANCFGNNAAALRKAINEKDLITIIDIIVAANNNINFSDPTITKYFITKLKETMSNKYLTDVKTNERVSCNDLLKQKGE